MKNTILTVVGVLAIGVFLWWAGSLSSSDPETLAARGLHWHTKIDIFVKGESIEVPANIGLIGGHNPIHTHDEEPGVIHLEFDGKVTYADTELGNFFKIWNKEFSSTQLFEYVNGEEGVVSMTVNGEVNTEFEKYQMKDGDEVVISFE